ncbi:MAG TPA: hypothetical protein VGF67_14150 [Ktedonobacteraceae bacterium]
MPSSTIDDQNAWSYQEVGGLPLPGPALVIDTRQCENQSDFDPMALLVYLWCEMHDLAREMRQQRVESWGNLHTFLGFRKVNMVAPDEYVVHDPRTWEPGKMAEHTTGAQLTAQLGALVNELRNQRIACTRLQDPNRSMVRVIFLVDLAEQEPEEAGSPAQIAGRHGGPAPYSSFDLAVACAESLKTWCADEQGLYSEHDESLAASPTRAPARAMLETVAVCLNTRTRKHYHLLTDLAAAWALDMLILVQPYRQDYGYLDQEAQLSYAELTLSALLLHWPESMQPGIEDQPDARRTTSAYSLLPRPVYILGSATIEYAARWGERWWSYGLETALLEQLLAKEQVEQQETQLQSQMQDWWENWRQRVRWTLAELAEHLRQCAGLRTLQRFCQPTLFQAHSIAALKEQVEAFMAWLRPFYREPLPGSLRELLDCAPLLVELSQQFGKPPAMPQAAWNAYLDNLHAPQREAQVCLLALFLQAKGSIPRALRHLQLLEERVARLQSASDTCNLRALSDAWERWHVQASDRLDMLAQNRSHSRRREKKLALQECASLFRSVQALQHKQYAIIYSAVEARYELALLKRADVSRPYSKRLKELQQLLETIHQRSGYLRDVAGQRLSLGSSKPLTAPWQQGNPATLHNRLDQLNQRELLTYFEQALDTLEKEHEPFALKFLAQAVLRFAGPAEAVGAQLPGQLSELERSQLGPQPAMQHLQVLEILLVSAFLAVRAGAKTTKMEPLLANYRQAIQQIQPAAGLLSQTIQEMEEVVRFASIQKKMYGSDLSSTVAWRIPDELPLAALLAGQPRDGRLEEMLQSTNLLRYLEASSNEAMGIVQKLDRQSTLAGFPDTLSGDETCYLYLPPGWAGDHFAQAVCAQLRSNVQIVRTPNIEKMIYLRVHRIYHLATGNEI